MVHEISLTNPKLIIFLGNTGYDYLKKKYTFDEFCPTTDRDGNYSNTQRTSLKEHSEYSKYKIYNFRNVKYLQKYYEEVTSPEKREENFNNKSFVEFNREDKRKLIKHLPRNFPTFGTIDFKFNSILKPIKFIKIFHNSKENTVFWKMYINDYKDLIKELLEDPKFHPKFPQTS